MRSLHGSYVLSPVARIGHTAYTPPSTAGASPPPLSPAAFPPCRDLFLRLMWLRSPLERSHIFFVPPASRIADMSATGLSTEPIEFIVSSLTGAFRTLLPRIPPADIGLAIVPPPSVQVLGRAHSSSLLSALLSIWLRRSSGLVFGRGLFLDRPPSLTDCRCAKCMAVMLTYALLTKRSKPILPLSLDAAPYPPPSDPR
jgi:hypothetical protein